MKNNPSLRDYKAAFIASTQKLAEYFNTTAGNLQALQKDVNEEIKLRVERILMIRRGRQEEQDSS